MHLVSISWHVSVVSEGRADGGALLYFSSLHLCRISKLLWWTGWWRKLKLSTLFKTAHGTASSCPWGSKIKTTKKKKWREEKDYISRNQERLKNKPEGRKSLRVTCFSHSTQFNLSFLLTVPWHRSDGLDRIPTPLIILISQSIITL